MSARRSNAMVGATAWSAFLFAGLMWFPPASTLDKVFATMIVAGIVMCVLIALAPSEESA